MKQMLLSLWKGRGSRHRGYKALYELEAAKRAELSREVLGLLACLDNLVCSLDTPPSTNILVHGRLSMLQILRLGVLVSDYRKEEK